MKSEELNEFKVVTPLKSYIAVLRRDFKIQGMEGDPGQKDKQGV